MNLHDKTNNWVTAGIITSEQRDRLLAFEARDAQPDRRGQRRLTATLATLGALLVGTGIILIIASNWDKISPFEKMGLLLCSLILTQALGWWLGETKDYPRVGRSLNFLGSILFGANIFLVAQAYNIRAHWPNGVLMWGLGTLPLALLFNSSAMAALAIVTLTGWIGGELSFRCMAFVDSTLFVPVYCVWGVLLLAIGERFRDHRNLRRLAATAGSLGLFVILVAEFPLTFRDFISSTRSLSELDAQIAGLPVLVGLSMVGAVISAVCLATLSRSKRREALWMGAWIFTALLMGWGSAFVRGHGHQMYSVLFAVIYFVQVIVLLYLGYLFTRADLVNLGLLAFGAFVLARYFDLAWKYMDRSLAFIVGGVLLLALGFGMERSRRKLLARMKTS